MECQGEVNSSGCSIGDGGVQCEVLLSGAIRLKKQIRHQVGFLHCDFFRFLERKVFVSTGGKEKCTEDETSERNKLPVAGTG